MFDVAITVTNPFELKFMLWVCRRAVHSGADDALLCQEVRTCFGDEMAFAALGAIKELASLLGGIRMRMARRVYQNPTVAEGLILSAYGDVRTNGTVGRAPHLEHLFQGNAGQVGQFQVQAALIARLFRLQAEDGERCHLSRFRERISARQTSGHLPPAMEATLVFALRIWVAAHHSGQDSGKALEKTLKDCLTDSDRRSIDTVLTNVAHGARRAVEISCICQDVISDDENQFLFAVAAARNGADIPACRVLADWQQPAAARLSVPAVLRLGQPSVPKMSAAESSDPAVRIDTQVPSSVAVH